MTNGNRPLEVVVLGSGSAVPDPLRGNPSIAMRMSRSSWNFATAVPVRRSSSDEDGRLLGLGRDGGAGVVAFGREGELGEVAVADHAAELQG